MPPPPSGQTSFESGDPPAVPEQAGPAVIPPRAGACASGPDPAAERHAGAGKPRAGRSRPPARRGGTDCAAWNRGRHPGLEPTVRQPRNRPGPDPERACCSHAEDTAETGRRAQGLDDMFNRVKQTPMFTTPPTRSATSRRGRVFLGTRVVKKWLSMLDNLARRLGVSRSELLRRAAENTYASSLKDLPVSHALHSVAPGAGCAAGERHEVRAREVGNMMVEGMSRAGCPVRQAVGVALPAAPARAGVTFTSFQRSGASGLSPGGRFVQPVFPQTQIFPTSATTGGVLPAGQQHPEPLCPCVLSARSGESRRCRLPHSPLTPPIRAVRFEL